VRTPLQSVRSGVLRRAAPECRYLVLDSHGSAVGTGAGTLGTEAGFQIDVTDRLPPGNYTLSVLMAVNGNVIHPDVKQFSFAIHK